MNAPNAATPAASRRGLLSCFVPVSLALAIGGSSSADAGLSKGGATCAPLSADADLIRACQQFAEAEFAAWYRYVTAPDHLADAEDTQPDWATMEKIAATSPTTLEGVQVKALACSA